MGNSRAKVHAAAKIDSVLSKVVLTVVKSRMSERKVSSGSSAAKRRSAWFKVRRNASPEKSSSRTLAPNSATSGLRLHHQVNGESDRFSRASNSARCTERTQTRS